MPVQIKAAVLLIVFFMNMIIGFACALGMCMCCINSHHEELQVMTQVPSCHHNEEAGKRHKSKDCKGNCCDDHVIKFSQVDKSFPEFFTGLNVIIFATLTSYFYNIDVLHIYKGSASIRYFVRSHHPPIPDIRIAIQSFQV